MSAIYNGESASSVRSKINSILAVSGTYVTLTGTEVLTNKNLTSGTNTFPTSLATLTGSQVLTNKDMSSGTNTFPTSLVTLTGSQTLTNKVLTSPSITTPTGIVKGDVGLGNIDNTSDANKPVSTAQATAIALKQTANSITTLVESVDTGTITANYTLVATDYHRVITVANSDAVNPVRIIFDDATPGTGSLPIGSIVHIYNMGSSVGTAQISVSGAASLITPNSLTNTIAAGNLGCVMRKSQTQYIRLY